MHWFLILFLEYVNFYTILPGETKQVEAIHHPHGLKVCVVYRVDKTSKLVLYRRWIMKSESVLEILNVNPSGEILISGCK